MQVTHLVNQHPKVSHPFIRREIFAVEQAGVDVVRWEDRRAPAVPVDPLDVEEAAKTHLLIDADAVAMLRAFVCLRRLHAVGLIAKDRGARIAVALGSSNAAPAASN